LEFIGASYGGSERKEAEGYNVERRTREIEKGHPEQREKSRERNGYIKPSRNFT